MSLPQIFNRQFLVPAVAAVLIFAAFWFGVFFRGFDQILFAPALLLVYLAAFLLLLPGLRTGWRFPVAPVTVFLFLFWLWMGLSLFWSDVPYISIIFAMTIGCLPLLFFAILQHPDTDRVIGMIWTAVIVAIAVLGLWAVFQFVFLSDVASNRIHHPMLNTNNLAVILSMGFFFLLLRFCQQETVAQTISGVLLVLVFIAIMATQSRGGSLGLLVGLSLFMLLCWSVIRARWMSFSILFPVIGLVAAFMLLYFSTQGGGEVRLIGGGGAAASNENRYFLWLSAWQMLKDHAFSGPGLGVFYLVFPLYRHPEDLSDGYFLHVDPIQFGIEMSVVATVLFYAFSIAVLVRMIRAVGMTAPGDMQRLMVVIPFCGLLSLMINTHVNFDLYMLPALLFGAILLSAWYRGTERVLGESRLHLDFRHKAHLVFLLPALIFLFIAGPVWIVRAGIAVQDAANAAIALQKNDLDGASKATAHALRYGPDNFYRTYYLDALWRGQILQNRFYALDAAQRQDLYDKAMESIALSMKHNPYNVQALSHKALLYYIAYPRLDPRGIDHAIATLEEALAIDPISFDARMGLARMHELQGNIPKAISILEDGNYWAVTRKYAPPAYLQMLANLKMKSGNRFGAAEMNSLIRERVANTNARIDEQSGVDRWIKGQIDRLLNR
ncbi:MAG: O-antigen ligase family protein [Micavibrio sp.]